MLPDYYSRAAFSTEHEMLLTFSPPFKLASLVFFVPGWIGGLLRRVE